MYVCHGVVYHKAFFRVTEQVMISVTCIFSYRFCVIISRCNSMKLLRETAAAVLGVTEALLKSTDVPKKLVQDVFKRLVWSDRDIKVCKNIKFLWLPQIF